MEQLIQVRMQEHELTMRQMVEEIHRGQLNIGQAAAKFEVNRKTVNHWLDKVEAEAVVSEKRPPKETTLSVDKKRTRSPRSKKQSTAQVEELIAKLHSLEQELEAAKFKALYYSTLVQTMQINYPQVRIRQFEELLGFSRQGYYQYWQRQAIAVNKDTEIVNLVKKVRKDHPRTGGRKLYQLLESEIDKRGIRMGRDAFFTLLSEQNMVYSSADADVK
jgi:transposase-like protein